MATKRKSKSCRNGRCGLGRAVSSGAMLIDEVKRCNSHFFDADTMRFFKSRLLEVFPSNKQNATYFVTSEQGPNNVRAYSVRKFASCKVNTVGEFQGYATAAQAKAAARRLAK